jgi:propionyl-CoA synthetase
LGDDDRFVSGYLQVFDGYYATGDGGFVDDDGTSMSWGERMTINVAGHRLSTGSMEAGRGAS